ncbi:MAG: hypothetical protein Q4C65_06870 [Eubacteriales bacterium]|nr:hypothetical protein [Eubacteriales bacterium]
MAMSQLTSNLLSSITGNVNKAYLLLNNKPSQTANGALGREQGTQVSSLRNAAAALQNASGLAGSSGNVSLFGAAAGVTGTANQAGFLPLQVQYNPSSVSLESTAGTTIRQSVGGDGENAYQQMERPEETVLRMELIFDDMNIKDSFMWDNLRLSAGDALQMGKNLAQAAKGGYSVHTTVEALVGAVCRAQSRIVGMVWNKMYFWGELFSVQAEYTMFNRQGNPVRARVRIQIRQDEPSGGGSSSAATDQYWNNAYNKLFQSASQKNGQTESTRSLQNLINGL